MNTTMAQETKLRKKDSMCHQCPQEAEKLVRPENERCSRVKGPIEIFPHIKGVHGYPCKGFRAELW
jgi:hypothetical protein